MPSLLAARRKATHGISHFRSGQDAFSLNQEGGAAHTAERWLGPVIALSPDQSAVLVQTLNRYLATGDLSDTARKL